MKGVNINRNFYFLTRLILTAKYLMWLILTEWGYNSQRVKFRKNSKKKKKKNK